VVARIDPRFRLSEKFAEFPVGEVLAGKGAFALVDNRFFEGKALPGDITLPGIELAFKGIAVFLLVARETDYKMAFCTM
jgi:hypothetical protein